jgi:glycosidase
MNKPVLKRSQRTTICLAAVMALSLSAKAPAQTLARPGWAGSGMATQSWFKHAVFYRIDTRTFARAADGTDGSPGTLKGVTTRLDYLRDLGIDAILLEDLGSGTGHDPIDPAFGTVDDFDALSLQAGKKNLRILVTLSHPDPALARYWLTRGVAGFYVPGSSTTPAIAAIRKLLPGSMGQRILITDADLSGSSAKPPLNELQLDQSLTKLPETGVAAGVRTALESNQRLSRTGSPALATKAQGDTTSEARFAPAGSERDAAKLAAAVMLLSRAIPVIYAGQELGLAPSGANAMIPWGKPPVIAPEAPALEAGAGATVPAPAPAPAAPNPADVAAERYVPYVPPVRPVKPVKPPPPDPATVAGEELDPGSVLSFYRQLIQLHHGKTSVRDGDQILLNDDSLGALVWVRKTANPSLANPPLVVICNFSANPLSLPLKGELTKLHLRGSFLRSPLSPETQKVTMDLEPITLSPFGVYTGDLKY